MTFVVGAVMNAVRGGQWRVWLGPEWQATDDNGRHVKLPWLSSDMLNELGFGVTVLLLTGNAWLAAACAVAMAAGARPSWGEYIGALGGWQADNMVGVRIIDKIIAPLKRWPRWWGFAGLTLRGAWWCGCIAAVMALFGRGDIAMEFLTRAPFMGVAYWVAMEWMRRRVGDATPGWGLSEIFWGAVLWDALGG